MGAEQDAEQYDLLPYTNNAFGTSHPTTLATVATLHGLDPPPLSGCRVLELGCGRGGNLLPMAEAMPASHFVGVDLSGRQIEEADFHRVSLALDNVQFHQMDLIEIDERFGTFDFILAHGLYSWVPDSVQQAILRLCADRLSPKGIAYISYNTYPGWHYRGVVRDMIGFQVERGKSPSTQVAQARRLLKNVIEAIPDKQGVRTQLVLDECQVLVRQPDAYIFHEQLEADNSPCYFHDFATKAGQHGLQFVGEARVEPLIDSISTQSRRALEEMADHDRLRYEQLLDFLVHRTFRRSVVCRAGRGASATPQPEFLAECFLTSLVDPVERPSDLNAPTPLTFRTSWGTTMTSQHPLIKRLLLVLSDMGPLAVKFDDFRQEMARQLGRESNGDFRSELLGVVMAAYRREAIQVSVESADFCPHVTDLPTATPVARLQASGDSRVTNREHRSIDLSSIDRALLIHMDGAHDCDSLKRLLLKSLCDGGLQVEGFDLRAGQTAEAMAFVERLFEQRASYLAKNAFLKA